MKLALASEFVAVDESDWREAVDTALKGKSYSSLISKTLDDLEIAPLYRGCSTAVTMPRPLRDQDDLPWDIIQRCDAPDLAKANKQALADLNGGANGLSIVLPGAVTAGGYGVPVANSDDFKRLLQDVELDLITVRLDSGIRGREVARFLIDVYRDRNLDLSKCRLVLGLDPVSSFARTGTIIRRSAFIERMSAVIGHCRDNGFTGTAFVADARVYQNAGSSGVQDVGLVAAALVENMRSLCEAGLSPAEAVSHMGIVIGATQDQFASICKLRALRLVWQRICQTLDIKQTPIRIDIETSWRMITRNDPHVNLLRATSAVFAAGAGGADGVTVLPFSFARGLPDGFARRMARNTQIILQQESGIGRVDDPAAGSGHVEQLTQELASHGWTFFQSIEAQGGIFAALSNGFVHSAISDKAQIRRKLIAERRIKLTGVTEFAAAHEPDVKVWDIVLPDGWSAPAPESGTTATGDEMVCDRLVPHRLAEDFERLRDAAGRYATVRGKAPDYVFLANLGSPAQFTARSTFVRNLLAAGGIVAVPSDPANTGAEIARPYKASGCPQACICSSDTVYETEAAAAAKALKAAGANYVWLAGRPGANEAKLRAAGVDGFMYDGMNVLGVLQTIHALNGLDNIGLEGSDNV